MTTGETRELHLDRASRTLVGLERGREVLRAPVAVPESAILGRVTLAQRAPTLPDLPPGAAWVLSGPGLRVYGAHWHNRFGELGERAGWEVLPWVARWLAVWLPEDASVQVV